MTLVTASELAHRLGREAEAVCRHYLSNGHREGHYWLVGDAHNTAGRSLYVRLSDMAKGPAGKWTDAATGEHGDLLDIIAKTCSLTDFHEIAEEARLFLAMPRSDPPISNRAHRSSAPQGSPEAAQRLLAMTRPIWGTVVEAYLRKRGITDLRGTASLRFHAHCYYRPDEETPTQAWPAMIARVTAPGGSITGAHRTWLDPAIADKAPIATPRRAMGDLLGNAVRFGAAGTVMAAGEGIETVLSARQVLPSMPMMAALSAAHLSALTFPEPLQRLYILRDRDRAGDGAQARLADRAHEAGIETIILSPDQGDFNEDLQAHGLIRLADRIATMLDPADISTFLISRR